MNKRKVLASLEEIANVLDNGGLFDEANTVTNIMTKLANDEMKDFDLGEEDYSEENEKKLNKRLDNLLMYFDDDTNMMEDDVYPEMLDYTFKDDYDEDMDYTTEDDDIFTKNDDNLVFPKEDKEIF